MADPLVNNTLLLEPGLHPGVLFARGEGFVFTRVGWSFFGVLLNSWAKLTAPAEKMKCMLGGFRFDPEKGAVVAAFAFRGDTNFQCQ